jgi:hypothetical protein
VFSWEQEISHLIAGTRIGKKMATFLFFFSIPLLFFLQATFFLLFVHMMFSYQILQISYLVLAGIFGGESGIVHGLENVSVGLAWEICTLVT